MTARRSTSVCFMTPRPVRDARNRGLAQHHSPGPHDIACRESRCLDHSYARKILNRQLHVVVRCDIDQHRAPAEPQLGQAFDRQLGARFVNDQCGRTVYHQHGVVLDLLTQRGPYTRPGPSFSEIGNRSFEAAVRTRCHPRATVGSARRRLGRDRCPFDATASGQTPARVRGSWSRGFRADPWRSGARPIPRSATR